MEKQSRYVLQGIETGRSSRRRKTVFHLEDILLLRLDAAALSDGVQQGWLKGFQKGLPNSDGKPRNGKIQLHLGKAPRHLFW